ncbi:MAG: hypothetical protein ACHQ0J_05070 [Candidatus Dormibacterales bacterium]
MSKRLPGLYFRPGVRTILTLGGEHDHSPGRWHEGPSVVVCDDARCRQELIRKGGIELVSRTWFIARDRASFNVTQDDGSNHLHEPAGKDYTVTCDSPTCNAFFANDHDAASLKAETRPKTVAEIDAEQQAFEARAREEAAIEVEVGRQRRSAMFPMLRR